MGMMAIIPPRRSYVCPDSWYCGGRSEYTANGIFVSFSRSPDYEIWAKKVITEEEAKELGLIILDPKICEK